MAICPECEKECEGYVQEDGKYYFRECKHPVPVDHDKNSCQCICQCHDDE